MPVVGQSALQSVSVANAVGCVRRSMHAPHSRIGCAKTRVRHAHGQALRLNACLCDELGKRTYRYGSAEAGIVCVVASISDDTLLLCKSQSRRKFVHCSECVRVEAGGGLDFDCIPYPAAFFDDEVDFLLGIVKYRSGFRHVYSGFSTLLFRDFVMSIPDFRH